MSDSLITTSLGQIQGVSSEQCIVFKGIPYAKPPVGELRWKAPVELEPWEGVYQADRFADIPYQRLPDPKHPIMGRFVKEFYGNPDYVREMSEDCLYLNIWIPKQRNDTKLPVAFWIHGGGFGGGFASELEFDGESYCSRGVILVTVEYRTGALGFLAHPWLSEENERGISGNYGILDQIQALKWVYENIEAFGGDPELITVFGQSAGSMSTQVLVSSDLTGNRISRAIMQSGLRCDSEILFTPTLKEEEELGSELVELTGAGSLEELRKLTPEELMKAKDQFDARMWQMGKGLTMVPNVDGYVLKQTVGDVWQNGLMKQIPYMLGCVTDDLGSTPEEVKVKNPGILLEECKQWSLKTEEVYQTPSYVYHFSRELPGDDWGSFHSCELWYMFGTLDRCWRPMTDHDYELSSEMMDYWTSFMKTGIASLQESEGVWRPYSRQDSFVKIFQ